MPLALPFGIWMFSAMAVELWTCAAADNTARFIVDALFFPLGVLRGTALILSWWS